MLTLLLNTFPSGKAEPGPSYFDVFFQREWLKDPLVKKMIKGIDKADLLDNYVVKNNIFNREESPRELSGGVKSLICILNNPDIMFLGDLMGENCMPFLLEIGKRIDVTVELTYFANMNVDEFDIKIANDNSIVHNRIELLKKYGEFLTLTEEEELELKIEDMCYTIKFEFDGSITKYKEDIDFDKKISRDIIISSIESGKYTKEEFNEELKLLEKEYEEDYEMLNYITEDLKREYKLTD